MGNISRALPSLNAIRFFECAARHSSFTRASEELCVTQGAVSKQIKLLEQQLDCQLFLRKGPYLSLTTHGEKLRGTVTDSLDIIKHGVASLRAMSESNLTLSVLPSFASNWLIPRLGAFEEQQAAISIHLKASFNNVNFAVNTDIDAAIRLGEGNWKDLTTLQLTQDAMFPVCTPRLAAKITTVSDLNKQTLLIDPHSRLRDQQLAYPPDNIADPYNDWSRWFETAKHSYSARNTKYYDETGTLIRAAIEGQGVYLAREELIQDQIASGVLRRLFKVEFYSNLHYYFVCPDNRKNDPNLLQFRNWLKTARGF